VNRIHKYCHASGAKLNWQKSHILQLNCKATPITHNQLHVLHPNEHIHYLGVKFGQTITDELQVADLSKTFYSLFEQWRYRARTVQGRKLIVNTMILSKLWHQTLIYLSLKILKLHGNV